MNYWPVYRLEDYMLRFMLKTFLILAIEVPSRTALGVTYCVYCEIYQLVDHNSVNLYTIVQQYLNQQETPEHLVLADL